MEASYSNNADRLQYLYLNLVGHVVQVSLIDGTCVEGVFMSRSDVDAEGDSSIMLCCTRYVSSVKHKPLDPSCVEFNKDTVIPYRDIVMVEAQNVKIRTEAPGRVDGRYGELSMDKFDWADDGANELLDNGTIRAETWDQFEVNEKTFGVRTTYKEELYTTRLDQSQITDKQRAEAERLAYEITASSTRGIAHRMEREECFKDDEGRDEGTLYSDVQRPQREEKVVSAPTSGTGRKRGNETQPPPPPLPPQAAAAAVAPPVTAAAAAGVAVASFADENPMRQKRADEEKHNLQHDNHLKSPGFNPAATPYTPMKTGPSATVLAVDFLTALANAVSNNNLCYTSPSNWPGGPSTYYDQDDSSYSHSHEISTAPVPGVPQQMFMGQQPPVPPHHRGYQNAGARMNPNLQIPMHHMPPQQFHQQHHQHQHHQAQQQQSFHNFGNYVPPQHHTAHMQDYMASRSGIAPSMRNPMRPTKSNLAPRSEPQQPVSTNTAVAPSPLPAVDSTSPPASEVRPTPKLQRGRGATAVQRGDVDGSAETGGGSAGPVGPKKRSGK